MERLEQCRTNCDTAVALGTFDGLHLGHQSVLEKLKRQADVQGLRTLVFTFENLPSSYFGGEQGMLFLPEEKEAAFEKLGVDLLYMPKFDGAIAGLEREDFAKLLFEQLRAKAVVVGFNFRFGKSAQGTPQYLKKAAEQYGATVYEQEPYLLGGEPVSSTRIRAALRQGEIAQAQKLLGRPYEICGIVAHGKQLGRKLGFPTLNFYPPECKLMPRHGVYAAEAELDGKRYAAVANIGIRPTVKDGDMLSVESNLIGFSEDAYGKKACLRLVEFLRGEQKFDGLDALTSQIAQDKRRAEECVKNAWQRGLQAAGDVLE